MSAFAATSVFTACKDTTCSLVYLLSIRLLLPFHKLVYGYSTVTKLVCSYDTLTMLAKKIIIWSYVSHCASKLLILFPRTQEHESPWCESRGHPVHCAKVVGPHHYSSMTISTLPVHSPASFQNLSQVFPVLAVANTGSSVGPQNKIGHPAGFRFPCWVLVEYK